MVLNNRTEEHLFRMDSGYDRDPEHNKFTKLLLANKYNEQAKTETTRTRKFVFFDSIKLDIRYSQHRQFRGV